MTGARRYGSFRYATAGRFERPTPVADAPQPSNDPSPVTGDAKPATDAPPATAEAATPAADDAQELADPQPSPPFLRSPACPQVSSPVLDALLQGAADGMAASEDCLRLSVTTPDDLVEGERLPVMVWIHGGAYVTGGGDLAAYDPSALVAEQRVVVVTVTYRLGVLGWLGDGVRVPANLGLLDLIEAVRWVNAHIEAFGGDPGLVTLFGQSSGADAIAHLVLCDEVRGLVRRVILQSAPFGIVRGRSALVAAMLTAVGRPRADGPVEAVLALQPVAEKAARRFGLKAGMPFGPQLGHAPLPAEERADAGWRRLAADGVDVLVGSTADETGLYYDFVPGARRLDRVPVLGRLVRTAVVRASTRYVYGAGARAFARRHRDAGGRATGYRFTWGPDAVTTGSVHMSELPLLLGTRESWQATAFVGRAPGLDAELDHRGRLLRQAWADFARTGSVPRDLDGPLADTVRFDRGTGTADRQASPA